MASTFTFKAVDLAGVPAKGELEADSKQAVTDQLRGRGLIVLDINEEKASLTNKDLFDRFRRIKPHELTVMTRQLATMVAAGVSILRAFHVLEEQTENEKLKEILAEVRQDIEAGISMSDSLEKHPDTFDDLYVAMTRTGETAGMLEEALERIADQMEKSDSLRRQVKAAMAYPMMIGLFALVTLLALVTFLVPVFEEVFADFNGKLPFITQLSVGASKALRGQWYLIMLGTAGIVIGFRKWKKTKWGLWQWDAIKMKLPAKIGDVILKIGLARWSRTFSGLVHSGVPLLQAIDITAKTAGNSHIEKSMEDVKLSVQRGGTISEPLRASPLFPSMVAHMVGIGEETGNLDGMLSKVADFYEDEVAAVIKALTSILEPIMILVVGGIVGFIVISMYLPLFQLYDNIR
jgi:type IV pilus assembly protein PilC